VLSSSQHPSQYRPSSQLSADESSKKAWLDRCRYLSHSVVCRHLAECNPALISYHYHLKPRAIELCDRLRRVRQELELLPSCDVIAFLGFAVYNLIPIQENQLNICEHIAHRLQNILPPVPFQSAHRQTAWSACEITLVVALLNDGSDGPWVRRTQDQPIT
jgi:hypothetical protein